MVAEVVTVAVATAAALPATLISLVIKITSLLFLSWK